MCGRYTLRSSLPQLVEFFGLQGALPELPPRYNVAPTQAVPVVRLGEAGRELALLHWGLVPAWAKDPSIGNRMINARSETATEKPSFRTALKRRRCLVVTDGFFEWKKNGKVKQPYWIGMRDRQPFAFAGLWEVWKKADPPLESCTILTTSANDLLSDLHDRMPVILDPADYDLWLNAEESDAASVLPLMQPFDAEPMECYPVDTVVNNPRNDVPECIEPLV